MSMLFFCPQAALLDSLYGIERGLTARSEIRAEINEVRLRREWREGCCFLRTLPVVVQLISQLEAKNPTPNPAEVLDELTGNWKLVYTSNSALMAVLALSKLPFVTVGDITQKIDAVSRVVETWG